MEIHTKNVKMVNNSNQHQRTLKELEDKRVLKLILDKEINDIEDKLTKIELEEIESKYLINKEVQFGRGIDRNSYRKVKKTIKSYLNVDEINDEVLRDFSRLYSEYGDNFYKLNSWIERGYSRYESIKKMSESDFRSVKLLIDYHEGRVDGVERL